MAGKAVELREVPVARTATRAGRSPRISLLENLNQAIMCNPRNAYQRYNAATNTTDRVLNTYMGTLLPGSPTSPSPGPGSKPDLQ